MLVCMYVCIYVYVCIVIQPQELQHVRALIKDLVSQFDDDNKDDNNDDSGATNQGLLTVNSSCVNSHMKTLLQCCRSSIYDVTKGMRPFISNALRLQTTLQERPGVIPCRGSGALKICMSFFPHCCFLHCCCVTIFWK